ncbi:GNAT family N-acetyltransferase [Arthrobacter roseus]|uniref:GNAT family N-acetyltransferase n=1 Tax=Arthrobacter roseus TaxID=136274 RepID=UPI0019635462|nr:N-acetyltransferase [Arthrobacter roseus]MBM7848727.1 putative GNAT family acetyltransferase [Arthrobacter roseus]
MSRVQHNFAASRFDIYSDGIVAASVHYRMNGAEMSFIYTEINDSLQTPPLVQSLIRGCLDNAHRHRLAVLPFCPTMCAYIKHHTQYTALVPLAQRERFYLPTTPRPPRQAHLTVVRPQ